MPKMMRALVETSVSAVRYEFGKQIGVGLVVDFDEVIAPKTKTTPAFTLGDALAGRHDCFEPVTPAAVPLNAAKE